MARSKKKESDLSPEQIKALVKQLNEANEKIEKLEAESVNPVGLKRHRWGALQITGIRNGFVGFYRDEWELILDQADRIRDKLDDLSPDGDDGVDPSEAILNKDQSYQVYAEEREAAKKK